MASKSSSGSSGGHYHPGGPVFIGGMGGTRVETREVTKEVVKEVPKEPMPITCPFCTRSYIPAEHNFVCPSCGAATPKDLIEESQMPDEDSGQ
jgi:transcription elongation factor Elf1